MKSCARRALVFFLALFVVLESASAANVKNRWSAEIQTGRWKAPNFLLDRELLKHPRDISGPIVSFGAAYAISEHWSLHVGVFRIDAAGSGEWSRGDLTEALEKAGIAGTLSGRAHFRIEGAAFEAERSFGHWRVKPFLRFGAGLGKIRVRFNGILSYIDPDLPILVRVLRPVEDAYTQNIPIVAAEGGANIRIVGPLSATASLGWNTGTVMWGGLQIKF